MKDEQEGDLLSLNLDLWVLLVSITVARPVDNLDCSDAMFKDILRNNMTMLGSITLVIIPM